MQNSQCITSREAADRNRKIGDERGNVLRDRQGSKKLIRFMNTSGTIRIEQRMKAKVLKGHGD